MVDVAHDEVPVRCWITMIMMRSPPRWQTEKMDATETMEKTAQMPATAMTVQMMLTEPPV